MLGINALASFPLAGAFGSVSLEPIGGFFVFQQILTQNYTAQVNVTVTVT